LESYSTRIGMSYWIFAGTGAGVIVVALLAISFHAVKAAMANPVKCLRTE